MSDQDKKGISRRDILKGLATAPVLGAFWWSASAKGDHDTEIKKGILNELDIKAMNPPTTGSMKGDVIKLGIIGAGGRGIHLMRTAGYATPQWLDDMKENARKNPNDTRLKSFLEQEDLNVRFTAVCDVFDVHMERAYGAAETDDNKPIRYVDYQDLLADPNVDAVIIATPDHTHAPIALDAVRAGKHVYVEKCMTHKIGETLELEEAVNNSSVVFQVGHQHRQTLSFLTAQDAINKNVLGHVSLVQTNTNRNDDAGAWQYNLHPEANEKTIDWKRFLGPAPDLPFSREQFSRWRKWWVFGTGLSGDLLTHDFDRINCVLKMGLPSSVMASGGIYSHRDGREVPDVLQVSMEFPEFSTGSSREKGLEKGMTFLYSATLGNGFNRGTLLMGHDATMELGESLSIYADYNSTRYKDLLEKGVIDTSTPMYGYNPQSEGVDGVTSATAKYFAEKGLLYTYRDGKRVDSAFLHIREWLSCIRHGGTPSCSIKEGMEEAISSHMATLSYKTGKQVLWDDKARKVVIPGMEGADLDAIITDSKLLPEAPIV
ncbi:MAG TPA: oxidoreductase [Cytophagales bacterium]|nr:oxidoreductase [Cytophagales bacterium]